MCYCYGLKRSVDMLPLFKRNVKTNHSKQLQLMLGIVTKLTFKTSQDTLVTLTRHTRHTNKHTNRHTNRHTNKHTTKHTISS